MKTENPGRIVKIRRNSERFWLRNVRPLDGKLFGEVNNHVMHQPFHLGQIIEFSEDEIIEEYKEPV